MGAASRRAVALAAMAVSVAVLGASALAARADISAIVFVGLALALGLSLFAGYLGAFPMWASAFAGAILGTVSGWLGESGSTAIPVQAITFGVAAMATHYLGEQVAQVGRPVPHIPRGDREISPQKVVAHEMARARRSSRPLSIALVRVTDGADAKVARAAHDLLVTVVRETDRIVTTPDGHLVLCPETPATDRVVLAGRIELNAEEQQLELQIQMATFPDDGPTFAALMDYFPEVASIEQTPDVA